MCMDPIEPATAKGRKFALYLTILMWIFFVLALIKITFGDFSGMTDLCSAMILMYTYCLVSYWACTFFIVFQMFSTLICFVIMGKRIQNEGQLFDKKNVLMNLYFSILIISFIFYIISIIIAFYTYREFKALELEQAGNVPIDNDYEQPRYQQSSMYYAHQAPRAQQAYYGTVNTNQQQQAQYNVSNQNRRRHFQGQGVPIGGV